MTIIKEVTSDVAETDILSTAYAYLKMLDTLSTDTAVSALCRKQAKFYYNLILKTFPQVDEDFVWPLTTLKTIEKINYLFSLDNNSEIFYNAKQFILLKGERI